MSWGQIRLRPADVLFSRYLRIKIGHCEVCGRKGEGDDGIKGLVVSHFHGRRNENTRFDENLNCEILCINCHRLFHESPANYVEWKKKKLGEKRYKLLTLAANTHKRKDDVPVVMLYKKLLKEL
jgi:5-methylcytosine-specific restriction endonuclease McrA